MSLGELLVSMTIPTLLSRSTGSRSAHGESPDMRVLLRLLPKSNSTFVARTRLSVTLLKTYPAWSLIAGGTHVFGFKLLGRKNKQGKYQGEWGRKRKRYSAEWEKARD